MVSVSFIIIKAYKYYLCKSSLKTYIHYTVCLDLNFRGEVTLKFSWGLRSAATGLD